jgi:hypothetical protein
MEKYSEFERIQKISLSVASYFSQEHIVTIANLIRSNTKIKSLKIFRLPAFVDDDQFKPFVEALKFNTELNQIGFNDAKPSQKIAAQIEVLLTQNRNIAELRQYVKDHPRTFTLGFPLEIVNNIVDKMIVSYLKNGETKEATKKSIDEFLVAPSVKMLDEDTKIT